MILNNYRFEIVLKFQLIRFWVFKFERRRFVLPFQLFSTGVHTVKISISKRFNVSKFHRALRLRFPLNCHFFTNTRRTREKKILFQRNFQFLRISSFPPRFSQFDRIDDAQISQSITPITIRVDTRSTINNGGISKRLQARVGKINNARRVPFNRIDVGGHTLSGYSRWIPSSIVSQGVLIVIPLDAGHKRLNRPGGGYISYANGKCVLE